MNTATFGPPETLASQQHALPQTEGSHRPRLLMVREGLPSRRETSFSRDGLALKKTLLSQIMIALTLAGITATLLTFPTSAEAQETAAAPIREYDIPAGPLNLALSRFGAESGVTLIGASSLLQDKHSAGLQGRYDIESGFAELLKGTGLQAFQRPDNSYGLRHAPPSVTQLSTLTIQASTRETALGPVNGYVATRSGTGTKTDTPLIETPQSVSVISAEQMRMTHAQTLQQALDYTAGVASQVVNSNPATSDSMLLRGFDAVPESGSFYRDGMRYMTTIFAGKQEPYGLERLEVIKGASSVLYGAVAPGGLINAISKRPLAEGVRELNLEYGSFNRRQVSADLGGSIDDAGVWTYRVTALGRKSDTYVDFTRDDRLYIAPALKWQPSASTSVTLLTSFQRMRGSSAGALPVEGTLQPNPYGQLPRYRFLGEPDHNDFNSNTTSLGYEVDHAFSDQLKVHHALRYTKNTLFNQYDLGYAPTDYRTRPRMGWTNRDTSETFTTDTFLAYTTQTGDIQHQLIAGMDYGRDRYKSDRILERLAPIDIFDPVYGKPPLGFVRQDTPRRNTERFGLYLQDQMKIADRWVVLLGGRYDQVRNVTEDAGRGVPWSSEKDDALTGRAGLVHLFDNGWAPYASVSQSFEPASGVDRTGARLKPTRGLQYEAGIRYQPPGGNLLISAAVYELSRKNVTTPDPIDPGYSVQTGKVRSRGLELELKASLPRDLDIIGAYSYTDARVIQSNTPKEEGARFRAPYHLFSLWLDQGLAPWGMEGWRVAAGMRYTSSTPGSISGGLGVPGYTLFDMRVSYERGAFIYALSAKNLTDKRYISGECFFYGCRYGEPRNITASVSYNW